MKYLALFINIFTDPIVSFQELKKTNDWKISFMPFIVLMVLGAVYYVLLQDLTLEQLTPHRSQMPDAELILIQLVIIIEGPLRILMTTLIVLLIVKLFFGESTSYSNLLPYVSFSYLVTVLESVIKIPLMLKKWSTEVYTGLGLLDIGEKGTFINNLFAAMDLFSVWRIILIGIGLSVYYKKSAKPFIIAIFIYWFVQISIIAVFKSL